MKLTAKLLSTPLLKHVWKISNKFLKLFIKIDYFVLKEIGWKMVKECMGLPLIYQWVSSINHRYWYSTIVYYVRL